MTKNEVKKVEPKIVGTVRKCMKVKVLSRGPRLYLTVLRGLMRLPVAESPAARGESGALSRGPGGGRQCQSRDSRRQKWRGQRRSARSTGAHTTHSDLVSSQCRIDRSTIRSSRESKEFRTGPIFYRRSTHPPIYYSPRIYYYYWKVLIFL